MLAVAGCGSSEEPASGTSEIDEQEAKAEITEIGDSWAHSFADPASNACAYMLEELCDEYIYERTAQGVLGTLPEWQASFKDARVEEVEVDGDRATARFSNGREVGFERVDGLWMVSDPEGPGS